MPGSKIVMKPVTRANLKPAIKPVIKPARHIVPSYFVDHPNCSAEDLDSLLPDTCHVCAKLVELHNEVSLIHDKETNYKHALWIREFIELGNREQEWKKRNPGKTPPKLLSRTDNLHPKHETTTCLEVNGWPIRLGILELRFRTEKLEKKREWILRKHRKGIQAAMKTHKEAVEIRRLVSFNDSWSAMAARGPVLVLDTKA